MLLDRYGLSLLPRYEPLNEGSKAPPRLKKILRHTSKKKEEFTSVGLGLPHLKQFRIITAYRRHFSQFSDFRIHNFFGNVLPLAFGTVT